MASPSKQHTLTSIPVKTTCPYCGVGCGMEVTVQNDLNPEAAKVKLIGDKSHPANFGKLCVKGSSAGETISFEGRMMVPQIDKKPVSWDKALTTVAEKFSTVINEYGPDSVALYVSGQLLTEDYYVANKLMKGFVGSANIDTNSRLCMASAVVGYKRALGADAVPCSYEDLEEAELIVIVGSNTAWAHPIVYQRITNAKKKNPDLKIVVVDPRKTATCDIADLHLQISPGSDASLFNGLFAYLYQNGVFNQAYIEKHTEGFDKAVQHAVILQGDMNRVAKECGINPKDLEVFYQLVHKHSKMVTLYSQGVNQSSTGVDKSNAIINCHLATGRIGKVGMGPFSITGQPNAMGGREVGGLANQLAAHMDFSKPEHIDTVQRFWQAPNMAQQNGLKAVDMFQAVADGKIKAIWIMNTNPVVSMPDAQAVRAGLQKCEMVVVSDCMKNTDTTEVADVLLPALTWGETDGTVTNSDRTISRQRKFIEGPEQAKSDWWMICEVAKRMGFKAFDYASEVEIFREHAQLSGFENGGLRDFDISKFSNISNEEYEEFSPVQWPVTEEKPEGTKRLFSDGKFFTASGKAQFVAVTPKAPKNSTSREYPFVLNTGRLRDQWHTMTRTGKTPKLMSHRDELFVSMHPKDAETLGLKNHSLVSLKGKATPDYCLIARLETTPTQALGQVFVPMHWNRQFASAGNVDALVPAIVDPLSGQPESKHAVVKVEAFETAWSGVIFTQSTINLEGVDYWSKVTGRNFDRYEIALSKETEFNNLSSLEVWLKSKLSLSEGEQLLSYFDEQLKQIRIAVIENNQVKTVVYFGVDRPNIDRSWVGGCFANELESHPRRFLLAGRMSGMKDTGITVCSCFSVGLNTILDAIQNEKLCSVEEIGEALKAGTNCGSCVPELTEILEQQKLKFKELA